MSHDLRNPSRMGAIAIVVLLVAACQGGSSAPVTLTFPPAEASGPATAAPSATSTASTPVASPTATASATATDSKSPGAIDPRTDGLDVAFGEFAITLEAAVIRPGPVTLVVHNAGHLTHGFEMKLEVSGKGGADRHKIETRTFGSGETLRVEADLPAGVYEVQCFVSNHASRGMRTTLEVRADAPLVTPDPAAAPGAVRIVQFAFVAPSVDVPTGGRVTWTNDDPTPHTVTADGGAFDSKQLDPGSQFALTLGKPGSFTYHCEIHPTMVGTIVVR